MTSTKRDGADSGAPQANAWMLLGFGLGLLAMSPGAVLHCWFFAPVAALLLAGALILVAAFRSRVWPAAEGALAAALFGVVAVVVFAIGLPRAQSTAVVNRGRIGTAHLGSVADDQAFPDVYGAAPPVV